MVKLLKVGDEFHKDLCVVRVTSVTPGTKHPVRWDWMTYTGSGDPTDERVRPCGFGSHSQVFKFFEGNGFTYYPVSV